MQQSVTQHSSSCGKSSLTGTYFLDLEHRGNERKLVDNKDGVSSEEFRQLGIPLFASTPTTKIR